MKVNVETKPAIVTVNKVIIEMTSDEAQTFYQVCRMIGGDPEKTRRKHTDKLSKELEKYFAPLDCAIGTLILF